MMGLLSAMAWEKTWSRVPLSTVPFGLGQRRFCADTAVIQAIHRRLSAFTGRLLESSSHIVGFQILDTD
jgi:hypothetical protein